MSGVGLVIVGWMVVGVLVKKRGRMEEMYTWVAFEPCFWDSAEHTPHLLLLYMVSGDHYTWVVVAPFTHVS